MRYSIFGRFLAIAATLIAFVAPAPAQNTNVQLLALINSNVPSGSTTTLTAASMRQVLDAMVSSTEVSSTSCPGSGSLSNFQPFANTNNSPTSVLLTVFDGANCVPWAILNTSTHTLTFIGGALPTPRNLAARFGSMDVFQRGAGGSASIAVSASSTAYTVDGCYLNTGANEASTVSASTPLTSQSNKSANVFRNSGQTGTAQMTFGCPLDTDELIPARGNFVALSFIVQAGANWSPVSGALTANVLCGTGTPVKQTSGYTGQSTVATTSNNLTAGGSAVRFQVTSSAIVPANCAQMEVQFTWGPTGTAGANDSVAIDSVQLEVVPSATGVASPFQEIDFTTQLRLAQRHYVKTFPYGTAPAQAAGFAGSIQFVNSSTTVTFGVDWRFPVQMRVAPSVTSFNPISSNANCRNQTQSTDTTINVDPQSTISSDHVFAQCVQGTSAAAFMFHLTADAGI